MRRWLVLLAIGCGAMRAETLRDAMAPEGVLVLAREDRLEAWANPSRAGLAARGLPAL